MLLLMLQGLLDVTLSLHRILHLQQCILQLQLHVVASTFLLLLDMSSTILRPADWSNVAALDDIAFDAPTNDENVSL
jgi:hypothetical protein